MPGFAKDIGIGGNGAIYVIGTIPIKGGYGIYSWTGRTWAQMDGAAVRIAVDSTGSLWVVSDIGGIYRRSGGAWVQTPGLAKDIGVGTNGSVYIVGTVAVSADSASTSGTARTRMEWTAGPPTSQPAALPACPSSLIKTATSTFQVGRVHDETRTLMASL